jgi:hypothetical protein
LRFRAIAVRTGEAVDFRMIFLNNREEKNDL